jgi:hypothetical protein
MSGLWCFHPIRQGIIIMIGIILVCVIIVVGINLIFPATWSCQFNKTGDNLCWCGWDNRPTNEYGFNYTESNCNNSSLYVNNTNLK